MPDILDNLLLKADGGAILLGNGTDRLLIGQLSVPGPPSTELVVIGGPNQEVTVKLVGSITLSVGLANSTQVVVPPSSVQVLKTGLANATLIVRLED